MSTLEVLVDTSVWVEFFNRPGGAHHRRVADLLDQDRVLLVGIVAAELVRGCRSEAERADVETALGGLRRVELSATDWLAIGRELFRLRRQGRTASLSDAAIAHATRIAGASIYSLDADFDCFEELSRHP